MKPTAVLRLDIRTHSFASEQDLADHLKTLPADRYLFRGQSKEYRRSWPLIPAAFRPLSAEDLVDVTYWRFEPANVRLPIPLVPGTLDLPSLIPTNTRAYEKSLAAEAADDWAFEDMMVFFWTTVCLFIAGLACRLTGDQSAIDWLQHQWRNDYPHLYKLRSLGQHYGMDTGLLDATSSFAVAMWFATHDFGTGAYRQKDEGIVYQIDIERLASVQTWIESLTEHEGEFDARTIDIRDTPPALAPRPFQQQGWSLAGWDHPKLMTQIVCNGGLIRYAFPTGKQACRDNHLSRDSLVPDSKDDPLGALFERFWKAQPQSLADAQKWMDENWNVATEKRIVMDDEGNWFDQLAGEFERILQHYAQAVIRIPASATQIGLVRAAQSAQSAV